MSGGGLLKNEWDRVAAVAPPVRKRVRRSDMSPVTLRLTPGERAKLQELADGMTLSAYIRACLFEKEERRRKRRPQNVVADKKALAEALGLLGQSRIASNLNQLAHQANLGVLEVDAQTKTQIDQAFIYITDMRALLVRALKSGAA